MQWPSPIKIRIRIANADNASAGVDAGPGYLDDQTIIVTCDELPLTVTRLRPNTQYRVEVAVANALGCSDFGRVEDSEAQAPDSGEAVESLGGADSKTIVKMERTTSQGMLVSTRSKFGYFVRRYLRLLGQGSFPSRRSALQWPLINAEAVYAGELPVPLRARFLRFLRDCFQPYLLGTQDMGTSSQLTPRPSEDADETQAASLVVSPIDLAELFLPLLLRFIRRGGGGTGLRPSVAILSIAHQILGVVTLLRQWGAVPARTRCKAMVSSSVSPSTTEETLSKVCPSSKAPFGMAAGLDLGSGPGAVKAAFGIAEGLTISATNPKSNQVQTQK